MFFSVPNLDSRLYLGRPKDDLNSRTGYDNIPIGVGLTAIIASEPLPVSFSYYNTLPAVY